MAVFVAGPVTGGAVNPVRALGPALVDGQLPNIWIYIVGPLLGGLAAALVYARFLAKAQAPREHVRLGHRRPSYPTDIAGGDGGEPVPRTLSADRGRRDMLWTDFAEDVPPAPL